MRKSTMLVILAMVVILATPVLSKEVSRTSWRVDEAPSVVKDLTEGFEGVFPPNGWTIASPSGHTGLDSWFQGATSAYEGLYSAEVDYDEELVAQDCRMSFDYTIADGEDHLNFAVSASAYWMINYTLKVLVDDVEVFDLAAVYGDVSWVYEIHDVDLTAYNGQTITITFQYVGLDGAALYLDAIGINSGYTPPPPPEAPENDTCEGAFVIEAGDFDFEGDATDANGTYDTAGSGGCTGYSAAGNDVVYMAHMEPGDHIYASYTSAADASFYAITDCDDSANTCVAGADATFTGGTEVIDYVNETGVGMDLYLICDCYGAGNGGPYTLVGTLTSIVPVMETTWSSMKANFK